MICSLIILILTATPRLGASCLLQEGVGADFARIGAGRLSVKTAPPSVQVDYKDGLVSELIVSGGDCRTSKGIGIGNTAKDVEKIYGRTKKTHAYLQKGKQDRLGELGDYVLVYPRVAFVIAQNSVALYFIRSIKIEPVEGTGEPASCE